MDRTEPSITISFKSYKSRRVMRSVLAAEIVALLSLFELNSNYRSILLHHLIDIKSLSDSISQGSLTSEKRIILEIYDAQQAYRNQEISNIAFTRRSDNIANGFTEQKMRKSLLNLLQTGRHQVRCEQWILR